MHPNLNIVLKVCTKCNLEKDITLFKKCNKRKSGYNTYCKVCHNEQNKSYKTNVEKRRLSAKKYYDNNKERVSFLRKEQRTKNLEHHKTRYNNWQRKKRKEDILYRLQGNCRARIRGAIVEKNFKKNTKAMNLLGCNSIELKEYLEGRFKENMSWDNYGEWHIDHIIPLASAETEEEIHKLCHYTNLQPLWALENQSKGGKILTNE